MPFNSLFTNQPDHENKKSRKKEEILEIGNENPKEMQVSGTGQTGI